MATQSDMAEALLTEYDRSVTLLDAFRSAIEGLLVQLLNLQSIRVHSVTSRLKSRQSLAGKIGRIGKEYGSLADITDIVGVRVITHLEDEVDAVGSLIKQHFDVDTEHSIDKRKTLDPDRFGYLSVHYVCGVNSSRAELPEYNRFAKLRCEIQIRSILQHAWAEIEHDLGYKARAAIPALMRRRFSRLAGLLELADAEFTRLRDDLDKYSESVSSDMKTAPSSVELNAISLAEFISSNDNLRRLDSAMAEYVGASISDVTEAGSMVEYLAYVGIETIGDLERELQEHGDLVQRQWEVRLQNQSEETLGGGIGLFHLFQVLVTLQGGAKRLAEAFELFGIGLLHERVKSSPGIAKVILDIGECRAKL